jgi:hypothetical protein
VGLRPCLNPIEADACYQPCVDNHVLMLLRFNTWLISMIDSRFELWHRGRRSASTGAGSSSSRGHTWRHVVLLTGLLAIVTACLLAQPGRAQSAQRSHPSAGPAHSTGVIDPQRPHQEVMATPSPSPGVIPTTTPTTTPTPAAVVPAATPPTIASPSAVTPIVAAAPTTTTTAPANAGPSIASLVAEAEASGINPGPTWTWSIGDPSTDCGAIQGSVGTGCTSGAAGSATTVFAGSPSLGLVAHEIANAETENYAVPTLVAAVTTAEAGTSWSPIDAVASCLVEHFMGFQDDAAGSWQCPTALAATVANGIR